MNPADLDPAKLDVPDLAPKGVLLDTDGKPLEEKQASERTIAGLKRLLGLDTLRQKALEREAATMIDNRAGRRSRRAFFRALRRSKADAPRRARALARRRAKNAVAKQSRKRNRP